MYRMNFTLPGGVKLELAKRSDAKTIACMSRDMIEDGLGWVWTPERVRRHIRNPNVMVLVARKGQRLLGFGIMQFSKGQAHLNLLAVRLDYQRAGIGRELMTMLERCAELSGASTILLEVRLKNSQARAFYHSLGYTEISRIPHYYRGKEDAIRMAYSFSYQTFPNRTSHKIS